MDGWVGGQMDGQIDGRTGGWVGVRVDGWMNQSILTNFIPSGACNTGQECSKFHALTFSVRRTMARLLGGSLFLRETGMISIPVAT